MRIATVTFVAALATSSLLAQSPGDDSLSGSAVDSQRAGAAANDGSLSKVMDAFISAFASDVPAWRTDVQLGKATADSTPPDGFQKARSDIAGWYYFRPKTANNLTLEQRRAIMRDRRFPQFLSQMRAVADGKTPPLDPALVSAAKAKPATPDQPAQIGRAELMSRLLAGRRPPPDTIYFEMSPEELVLPGRMLITVNVQNSP